MMICSDPLDDLYRRGLEHATWIVNDRAIGGVVAVLARDSLEHNINAQNQRETVRRKNNIPRRHKPNLTREQIFQHQILKYSIELWPEQNKSEEDYLVRFLTLLVSDLYRRSSFHAIAGFVRLNYGLSIPEAYDLYVTLRPTSVSAHQDDPSSYSDAKTRLLKLVRKHFGDAIEMETREGNDRLLKPHDNPGSLREVAKKCLELLAPRLSGDIENILDMDHINKERLEGILSREDNEAELIRLHIAIGRLEEFVGLFKTSSNGRILKRPQLRIPNFYNNRHRIGLSVEKAPFPGETLSRPSRLDFTFQTSA